MKHVLFILCTAVFIWSSCRAETIEVNVDCSPSPEQADWIVYRVKKNDKIVLTTIGMAVEGEEKLVKDWSNSEIGVNNFSENESLLNEFNLGRAVVLAKCDAEDTVCTLMYGNSPKSLLHPAYIVCMGEVRIKFKFPNDTNPKKYVYHGLLTVTREDEKKDVKEQVYNDLVKQEDKVQQTSSSKEKKMEASTNGTNGDKMNIIESICSALGIKYSDISIKSLKLGSGGF